MKKWLKFRSKKQNVEIIIRGIKIIANVSFNTSIDTFKYVITIIIISGI